MQSIFSNWFLSLCKLTHLHNYWLNCFSLASSDPSHQPPAALSGGFMKIRGFCTAPLKKLDKKGKQAESLQTGLARCVGNIFSVIFPYKLNVQSSSLSLCIGYLYLNTFIYIWISLDMKPFPVCGLIWCVVFWCVVKYNRDNNQDKVRTQQRPQMTSILAFGSHNITRYNLPGGGAQVDWRCVLSSSAETGHTADWGRRVAMVILGGRWPGRELWQLLQCGEALNLYKLCKSGFLCEELEMLHRLISCCQCISWGQ